MHCKSLKKVPSRPLCPVPSGGLGGIELTVAHDDRVGHLNPLVLEDACRIHEGLVDGDRAHVVALRLRDNRAVDLALEHAELHDWALHNLDVEVKNAHQDL